MDVAAIERAIAGDGFVVLGGFRPEPGDGLPAPAETVVLVGNAGPALWRAFAASVPERQRESHRHPLDDWTRTVLAAAAARLGARALFPFDGPPWHPFPTWAVRAGTAHPSPIGPLIHPEYGLWHAYRGALVFAEAVALPPADGGSPPCETCADKPCLTACPVGAIARDAYDVPACTRHTASAAGADCLDLGCRARHACPVGRAYAHTPPQAAFHMRKFLALHGQDG